MGHIHVRKSGIQSTKPKIQKLSIMANPTNKEEEPDELLEQQEPPRPGILLDRKERVGAHVVEFAQLKGYIATDPCDRYPTMSSRGMNYIFIGGLNIFIAGPTYVELSPGVLKGSAAKLKILCNVSAI